MKLHVLHCGSVSLAPFAASMSAGGGNPASMLTAPESGRVTLPVSAYLLEHPRGLVLIDTGWCREICPEGTYSTKNARNVLGTPLAAFYHPNLAPGQAIHEQLAARGISPRDLELVILTHLDPDHVSGVKHVREAKRIILPEDEYFWSCRTVYKLRQPWRLWIDAPIERVYYRGFGNVPNNWAIDVFGDGTLYMVNLPGHTDGMCAVVAVNGKKFAVMCADAAFSRRSWESPDIPGFGFDRQLQFKSLKWVKEMSEKSGCVGVFASHDAEIMPQTIEF